MAGRRKRPVEVVEVDDFDLVPVRSSSPQQAKKVRFGDGSNDKDVVEIVEVKEKKLPAHIAESIEQIILNNDDWSHQQVRSAVLAFCRQNPTIYSVDHIAGGALGLLFDGFAMNTACSSSSSSSNSANAIDVEDEVEMVSISPATHVLAVLPDADLSEVEALLAKLVNNVEHVVQHMMEHGYKKAAPKSSSSSSKDPVKPALDFSSNVWETSSAYRADAVVELTNNFPFIRKDSLDRIFRKEKFHYYLALKYLEETVKVQARMHFRGEKFVSSLSFDRDVMSKVRETLEEKNLGTKILLRSTVKMLPQPKDLIDSILMDEILWIRRKKSEETELQDKKIAEELNYQMAADENALVECGCCCAEYPFERIVQCTEAHLFCKDCLQRYAEQTLFGDGRTTLKCMSTEGDPCPGVFTETMLRASLPEKVLSKFSEAQTRDVLKAANIDDLVTCHNCDFQASMGPEAGKILHCPVCQLDTCRECGDVAHIPLKCNEVEKKKDTDKRLTVEEALTQARVRECPKCKTRFYKIEGCNKMTCTCGNNICYICRKDITKEKYQHFCQKAHCQHNDCGKCKLYTNSVEDDIQAMRDAGLKALNEIQEDGEGNATQVLIESSFLYFVYFGLCLCFACITSDRSQQIFGEIGHETYHTRGSCNGRGDTRCSTRWSRWSQWRIQHA